MNYLPTPALYMPSNLHQDSIFKQQASENKKALKFSKTFKVFPENSKAFSLKPVLAQRCYFLNGGLTTIAFSLRPRTSMKISVPGAA